MRSGASPAVSVSNLTTRTPQPWAVSPDDRAGAGALTEIFAVDDAVEVRIGPLDSWGIPMLATGTAEPLSMGPNGPTYRRIAASVLVVGNPVGVGVSRLERLHLFGGSGLGVDFGQLGLGVDFGQLGLGVGLTQ